MIIPAPLAHPATLIVPVVRADTLGTVSVVMIAPARRGSPSGLASATSAGSARTTLSAGNRAPITPVEATRISSGRVPSSRASAAVVERATASPSGVQALAQPAFTRTARALPFLARSRDTRTGAAAA
jgi:hypothetical protein